MLRNFFNPRYRPRFDVPVWAFIALVIFMIFGFDATLMTMMGK